MSDTENTVDDVTTDVDTEIDTTDDTGVELTVDDYNKEKARREKAEKALVDLKRKTKELEGKSSEPENKYLTEADLEKREAIKDFIKANPDLADYRKELEDHYSKGIPLSTAKLIIENDDKTIANREKLGKTRVSDTEFSASKSEYTKAELNSLSDDNYNKVASQIKSGKIKLK